METAPHAWELLKDHVVYLHIKDAIYVDHTVVPAGYGDGKVREILTELQRRGYEGFLSLEPYLQQFSGLAGLEQHPVSVGTTTSGDGAAQFGIAYTALQKRITEIEA